MGTKIRNFEVGNLIGKASKFKIYLGTMDDTVPVIMKIANTFEDNNELSVDAGEFNAINSHTLQILEDECSIFGEDKSHYDWTFGNLVSSFTEPTMDDRRINVYSFPDINLDKLVPLPKLCARTFIDAKTSVWILGRFFKIYNFFESMPNRSENVVRYPRFNAGNFLISPEKHRLIFYNFTGDTADITAKCFVQAVAKFILAWTKFEEDPIEEDYCDLLHGFESRGRDTFNEAHTDLYAFVDKYWGRAYHPFTYRDTGEMSYAWKTLTTNKEED